MQRKRSRVGQAAGQCVCVCCKKLPCTRAAIAKAARAAEPGMGLAGPKLQAAKLPGRPAPCKDQVHFISLEINVTSPL
jgi:hypothetical protein